MRPGILPKSRLAMRLSGMSYGKKDAPELSRTIPAAGYSPRNRVSASRRGVRPLFPSSITPSSLLHNQRDRGLMRGGARSRADGHGICSRRRSRIVNDWGCSAAAARDQHGGQRQHSKQQEGRPPAPAPAACDPGQHDPQSQESAAGYQAAQIRRWRRGGGRRGGNAQRGASAVAAHGDLRGVKRTTGQRGQS